MSLVKPIIATIPAFDATLNHTFTFTSNGGDQVVANRITIRNNNTNACCLSKYINYIYIRVKL